MMYPLVQELAADRIPVRLTCGVLGFSPQAFYKWQGRPCSDRDWRDAHLINAIIDVHADDPEFGYRFLADELHAAGYQVGERRVAALPHAAGVVDDHEEGPPTAQDAGPGGP
jgi:hypothetical protein